MNSEEYSRKHEISISQNVEYWRERADQALDWSKKFSKVYNGDFENSKWFEDGELNACFNCIDRHVLRHPDKIAIIYNDNDNVSFEYTYKELLDNVMKVSNLLIDKGLKKGDCVALYMAMCPEAIFAVMACSRLGIIHNVIFGGFSPDSIILRMKDSNSKFLITQNIVPRAGSKISFWSNVVKVLKEVPVGVLLFDQDTKSDNAAVLYETPDFSNVDVSLWSNIRNQDVNFVNPVTVNSEDILFYLYTSGSTGKPKGMVHTTAGYLVYAYSTIKECFDIKPNDIFACTADIGWITGHTYSVYGPLLNGITTILFAGTPVYPDHYRLFSVVEKHKATQLYTAPTVIRTLRKYFAENHLEQRHDISSLRILGSVGEPINKEAYKWFTESFNNLPIVDSYWQTETGGIMIAPLPKHVIGQPECASLPLYGIQVVVARPGSTKKNVIEARPYELGHVLFKGSWPGIARSIINDKNRYKNSYFCYDGFYFTGDEGYKDKNGLVWIRGRADDVINVSGHRLSTAEIESATCTDPNVSEAAVIGIDDDITGQALCVFVVLKTLMEEDEAIASVKVTLRDRIGKLVTPKIVRICDSIPKTATGKIMRRVIRDIVMGKVPEDTSTCVNADSIESLRRTFSFGQI